MAAASGWTPRRMAARSSPSPFHWHQPTLLRRLVMTEDRQQRKPYVEEYAGASQGGGPGKDAVARSRRRAVRAADRAQKRTGGRAVRSSSTTTMASSGAGRSISKDIGYGALEPAIDFVRAVK